MSKDAKGTFEPATLVKQSAAVTRAIADFEIVWGDASGISAAMRIPGVGSSAIASMSTGVQQLRSLRQPLLGLRNQLEGKLAALRSMGVSVPELSKSKGPVKKNEGWSERFRRIADPLMDGMNPLKHPAEFMVSTMPGGKTALLGLGILKESEKGRHIINRVNRFEDKWDDTIHLGLDTVSAVPGIGEGAELINAGYYGAEGDWKNVGISVAGMLTGGLVTEARAATKVGRLIQKVDRASQAGKAATKAEQRAQTAVRVGVKTFNGTKKATKIVNNVSDGATFVDAIHKRDYTQASAIAQKHSLNHLANSKRAQSVIEKSKAGDGATRLERAAQAGVRGGIATLDDLKAMDGHVKNVDDAATVAGQVKEHKYAEAAPIVQKHVKNEISKQVEKRKSAKEK